MPPAKPVSAPLAPTTRWQGTRIGAGFRPVAAPTARAAGGRPIASANLAVAARLPEGDALKLSPYKPLELGPLHVEGEVEVPTLPAEILLELADRVAEALTGCRLGVASARATVATPEDGPDTPRRGDDRKVADGRRDYACGQRLLGHHGVGQPLRL